MAKLAYLLAAACAFVIAGCEKNNPEYCLTHSADFCPDDSGMPPMGCTANTDCTSTPATPLCDTAGSKTCVQCLAEGENPTDCTDASRSICTNHACRGCTAHSDCDSQLCLADGSCAAEGTISYVTGTSDGGTDNAACTKAMPCTSLAKAIGIGLANIKIHGSIDDGAMINRNLNIYADPGATLTRTSSGTILTVNNSSVVEINDLKITKPRNANDHIISTTAMSVLTLNRVTLSDSQANGIQCGGKSVTVNRSTIFNNGQIGISCTAGALVVNASKLYGNKGGGVVAMNSTFDITNSFIVHNGTNNSTVGGASLAPPAATTNRFEFNTVSDNDIRDSSVLSAGVFCDVTGFTAPNNLISHNEVNGDRTKTNANTSGLCTYPTSANAMDNNDFKFVNADAEPFDYRLQSGSTAIDKATTASTITVDAEGTTRPQGANKDQGADEYKP